MDKPSVVQFQRKMGYLWVMLPDSIHMNNYREVEEQIVSKIMPESNQVVLDLAQTKYLYSSGIGLLVRLKKRVSEEKGSLSLVNVPRKIRDILETAQLNRVFDIYATDVEFEISCGDKWEKENGGRNPDFIFVCQEEDGMCRINISGQMTTMKDLSKIPKDVYKDSIKYYIFDLTGLDIIDSHGLERLTGIIAQVNNKGGICVAYGANPSIGEMFELLGLTERIACFSDEPKALASCRT
jgi:anti-anti-sigma factor